MLKIRSWAPASIVVAALLAACGGSDPDVPGSGQPSGAPTTKGTFTAVVSFGDSLSDVGTYSPATQIPSGPGAGAYFGGRFTVNATSTPIWTATAKIWVENVASTLGITVTPAQVGFAGSSANCPAAAVPALATTCTAYGQGGALVTGANGIGHSGGFLTVPVKTQIANHLTRFTSFKASDLILVWAGDNDALAQFQAFAVAAQTIQADATKTADQKKVALFEAQAAAQAAMKTAALELSSYIRNEILGKGGVYVAVVRPVSFALTPRGAGLRASPTTAALAPVLDGLVDTFNLWLNEGLTGAAVKVIDPNALLQDAIANKANYGFTNVTLPACDAAKIATNTGGQITDGTSLFCNVGNSLRDTPAADPTTWLFADTIHPTPGGHKAVSDYVTLQLRSFGWIN
jgi:phospholipase/lecithinase/hemolysin